MRKNKYLSEIELESWNKYKKRGGSSFTRCGVNVINLDEKTTLKHKKGVIKECVKILEKKGHFITEAVPLDRPNRRVDVVDLSVIYPDGEIEVETNHKIRKKGARTIYV